MEKTHFQLSDQYRTNKDYIVREVAGEVILVPSGQAVKILNGLASLNATGQFLWQQMEQPIRLEELYHVFAQEYELTMEESIQDVNDFLELALTRNMVLKL